MTCHTLYTPDIHLPLRPFASSPKSQEIQTAVQRIQELQTAVQRAQGPVTRNKEVQTAILQDTEFWNESQEDWAIPLLRSELKAAELTHEEAVIERDQTEHAFSQLALHSRRCLETLRKREVQDVKLRNELKAAEFAQEEAVVERESTSYHSQSEALVVEVCAQELDEARREVCAQELVEHEQRGRVEELTLELEVMQGQKTKLAETLVERDWQITSELEAVQQQVALQLTEAELSEEVRELELSDMFCQGWMKAEEARFRSELEEEASSSKQASTYYYELSEMRQEWMVAEARFRSELDEEASAPKQAQTEVHEMHQERTKAEARFRFELEEERKKKSSSCAIC